MKYLVRVSQPQRDRANIDVDTFEDALLLLGKTEYDIKTRVKWSRFEDVYFHRTKSYIRIIKDKTT